MGGLALRSTDSRFGGLSDLRVSPDGARLLAVSDCGSGLSASLTYGPDGRLAGLDDARLVELGSGGARPDEVDAESLVVGREALEVGFEGRGGLRAYALEPAFAEPVRRLPGPPGLEACGRNGGLEAMTATADGSRFLACEARRGASLSVPAWIGRGETWVAREYPLHFDGGWMGEPFRPTGAALLPGGRPPGGREALPAAGARVVRLSRASLQASGPLEPAEVARIEPPLTIDNFEGVEARRDASSGRTLVYLLSDDNGCAKRGATTRAGPPADAALDVRPGRVAAQPASAMGAAISGSARRRSPSRFIFSCRVVGRTPRCRAACRWFPLAARRASSMTWRS